MDAQAGISHRHDGKVPRRLQQLGRIWQGVVYVNPLF
jgi:hypothetical protein